MMKIKKPLITRIVGNGFKPFPTLIAIIFLFTGTGYSDNGPLTLRPALQFSDTGIEAMKGGERDPEPADSSRDPSAGEAGANRIAQDNVQMEVFINEQVPESDRKALKEFLITGQTEIIASDGRRFIFRISEREEMFNTNGYTIDAFIYDDAGKLRNIGFFVYAINMAVAVSYINVDRNHIEISSGWYVEREFRGHYEGIGSTLLLFGLYHAAFKNAPVFIAFAPNTHARDILKEKFKFVIAGKDMRPDGALKAILPLDLSKKPFITLNLPHLYITAVADAKSISDSGIKASRSCL